MEILPWMMLSAALRVLTVYGGFVHLGAACASDYCLFIAFILAARRMIELADGTTLLGQMTMAQQFTLAHRVLLPVGALMIVATMVVYNLGWHWVGLHMLLGFDGIAYDQQTIDGFVWSAVLAAITLLLVIRAEITGKADLGGAFRELWQRGVYLAPAILAVAVADIGLSIAQGALRQAAYAFWQSAAAPSLVRALVFFSFIFICAAIRLWITLAILVFALRASYRHQASTTGSVTPS